MGLWKLRLSMLGTLALFIGLSTLVLLLILSALGVTNLVTLATIVVAFNVFQWLIAPYVIEAAYRVRDLRPGELEWLREIVERLARRSGIKTPQVKIAEIPIPNAFAYGSPLTGMRVAVTRGLVETLPRDEIEAVIGHELGHIKHHDVAVVMMASLVPALVFMIGRWLMFAGMFRTDREEGAGSLFALGLMLMMAAWVLNLVALGLSRLREYYADAHSAMVVDDGARKLQRALTRIVITTGSSIRRGEEALNYAHFRALFITDPLRATEDMELLARAMGEDTWISFEVERLKRRELTFWEAIAELFSTHPNIVKRLRALDELARAS